MNGTSLSLLARVRQGNDAPAWDRLVGLYAPLLKSWLRSQDVNSADIDDLVQDVFCAVLQEVPHFEHNGRPGAFRSWLRRTVVHRVQNYWRQRRQRPAPEGGSDLLNRLQQLEHEESELSLAWNQEHDLHLMAKLLEVVRPTFQEKTWEAFRRQVFSQHKPEQIARELQISISSVYMARHRVLNALRCEAADLIDSA